MVRLVVMVRGVASLHVGFMVAVETVLGTVRMVIRAGRIVVVLDGLSIMMVRVVLAVALRPMLVPVLRVMLLAVLRSMLRMMLFVMLRRMGFPPARVLGSLCHGMHADRFVLHSVVKKACASLPPVSRRR